MIRIEHSITEFGELQVFAEKWEGTGYTTFNILLIDNNDKVVFKQEGIRLAEKEETNILISCGLNVRIFWGEFAKQFDVEVFTKSSIHYPTLL